MKMEYERYRRNETNGNVGIIPEDSEVIRRRTMLQEQQREEIRRRKIKKRKQEQRRHRRRIRQAKEIVCLCICAAMLVLIIALVRRVAASPDRKAQEISAIEKASTEQQADSEEPKAQTVKETVQTQSQALPD